MRPAQALIDLDALRHNYRLARQLGGGRALAVVKADAYGHGLMRTATALADLADEAANGGAVAAITQENEAAYEVRKSSGEHFRTCAGVGGGVHVHEGRVFLRSKGEID